MDQALQNLLELSRDPVLAVTDGKISMMNAAARAAFPGRRVGDAAAGFLPELILSDPSEGFFSTAKLQGVSYTVSAQRSGETLYLSLASERSGRALRGCLSDSMLSGMLSALFNIGLSADRLREAAPADEKAQDWFRTLYHSYYILYRRLGNLNALCALSEGSMGIVLRHTDLVKLCGELVSSVTLLLGPRCAPVEFVTELESLPANLDAPKVERLLLNLLANSLEHTGADGQVRLRLGRSGGSALITVSDNGCGIPPDRLNSVFHSFVNRLDGESLSRETGGGIGLALCSVIAEKHGGTLVLESREGEGTTVRVMLPLSPPGMELRSDMPEYTNGGMTVLLTELSELLRSADITPGLPD